MTSLTPVHRYYTFEFRSKFCKYFHRWVNLIHDDAQLNYQEMIVSHGARASRGRTQATGRRRADLITAFTNRTIRYMSPFQFTVDHLATGWFWYNVA